MTPVQPQGQLPGHALTTVHSQGQLPGHTMMTTAHPHGGPLPDHTMMSTAHSLGRHGKFWEAKTERKFDGKFDL